MKKLLLIWFLPFAFVSCAPKIIPLKGMYLQTPYRITSDNNKEVVWDKVIDLFAQTGLPIKIIDKSSGLIISEKTSLKTTIETKDGNPVDKNAWLVVPAMYDYGSRKTITSTHGNVIGEWNVRIKETEGNKTIINVNIVNIKKIVHDTRGFSNEVNYSSASSTGVFEKMIADMVK